MGRRGGRLLFPLSACHIDVPATHQRVPHTNNPPIDEGHRIDLKGGALNEGFSGLFDS
jgi:hypothetical protein